MSLDLLRLRLALPHASVLPAVPALLNWAEVCLAYAEPDSARMLYEVAFLRDGFSPQHRAVQAEIARRTGLWPDAATGIASPIVTAPSTVEVAVAELETLAAGVTIGTGQPPEVAEHDAAPLGDIADLVRQLHDYLAGTRPIADAEVGALLLRLTEATRIDLPIDYRSFAAAPLPLLASAIAFAGLRGFLVDNGELAGGRFGSPALLQETARLSNVGLGPYLRNVGLVARKSSDVHALAGIAHEAAQAAGHASSSLSSWLTLLTLHLRGSLLTEVVDDLGDSGAMDVLAVIYQRVSDKPVALIDGWMVRRLRDSALDNLDYAFAAQAQALVVRLEPARLNERVILGTIEGSGGFKAAAEQTLLQCLAAAPEDRDLTERLLALRRGQFAPYVVDRGFGSPADRLPKRLRRRSGAVRTAVERTRRRAVEF